MEHNAKSLDFTAKQELYMTATYLKEQLKTLSFVDSHIFYTCGYGDDKRNLVFVGDLVKKEKEAWGLLL